MNRGREVLHGASQRTNILPHRSGWRPQDQHRALRSMILSIHEHIASWFCSLPPTQIDIDLKKVGNAYAIHVVVLFKVGFFKRKIFEFSINLPLTDKCACKSFNVLGIIKATFCFCLENKCIFFTYDISSVAGNWKGKVKLICI